MSSQMNSMDNPMGSSRAPILPPIGGIMNPPPRHATVNPVNQEQRVSQLSPSAAFATVHPPPFSQTSTTSNADNYRAPPPPHSQPAPDEQAGIASPPGGLKVLQFPSSESSHGGPGNSDRSMSQLDSTPQPQKMAEPAPPVQQAQGKPPPPPLDSMRAYRACINCRSRKSKCDLELNQGRPPCRRCQREDRECVLGESHRGGRRVRKKPKLENDTETPPTPLQQGFRHSSATSSQYSPRVDSIPGSSQPFQTRYDAPPHETGGQIYPWPHPTTSTTPSNSESTSNPRLSEHSINPTSQNEASYPSRNPSIVSNAQNPGDRQGLHETIASTDLQNPSDALEILAQVADRADDGDSSGDQNQAQAQHIPKRTRKVSDRNESAPTNEEGYFYYKPVQDGLMSPEMIYHLFSTYQEFFHPFFPIAPQESFDRSRLPWMSRYEPHLFSAILTVASKDNEIVHHICYDHMQHLVSMILAGADAEIEAVEALLLLSQWVSHRPQASVAVGRGEEDRVAWMYIGTALRLGYFLGIDRSAFKPDSREDVKVFSRKRLTWIACYMCDRQVSVRVGKGFWSRGPGPLTGLKGSDFPTLISQSPEGDNWGLQMQASLEIIQIFSNVHDILYSSKGHGWKEMLEGRYAKYLDDFRTSIRNWNDTWGTIVCHPKLKASMSLTYDYLRLYVNAFAYQATISRALTTQRDNRNNSSRPMALINATAPDARFIYEALDAAKSLLSTFNTLVEPETLRYMPSSYYLFIIYSAVFLYKARSTTTMTDEERTGVRRMIHQTIERLQKASVGANHMGSRYARLLQLLWRKAPKPNANNGNSHPRRPAATISERLNAQPPQSQNVPPTTTSPISSYHQQPINQNYDQSPSQFQQSLNMQQQSQHHLNISPQHHNSYPPHPQSHVTNSTGTAFSWLDLGATWNFATQNNGSSNAGSGGEMDMDDDRVLWDTGMSPFDLGLMADYSVLEGDNPNLIF